ncbi:RHOMBOID-like protein 5 [Argentina anserina]|uniref:RHOMBOID-like protein 5 n=1 Tax=Argentina anserina TaxID=57926 RepID=UPI0021764F90|nr:RHOMBOID-like protein 5 [Potentilla anserina]
MYYPPGPPPMYYASPPPPPPQFYAPPPLPPPQRRYSPWLVPLICLVNLGMFIYEMYKNDCPRRHSSKDPCILGDVFKRFSFEPFKDIPWLGPTAETIRNVGGLDRYKVVHGESWRLFSCMWLHAGVIHLFLNMISLDLVGLRLERDFGYHRFGLVYLLGGLGGSLASSLRLVHQDQEKSVSAGASGAIFGLLGASISELITNWTIYDDKFPTIMLLLLNVGVNVGLGFALKMDNSAHIGGCLAGFFLGFVFFIKPQFGYISSKFIPSYHDVKRSPRHNFCQYFLAIVGLLVSIALFGAGFGKLFDIKEIKQQLPDAVKKY